MATQLLSRLFKEHFYGGSEFTCNFLLQLVLIAITPIANISPWGGATQESHMFLWDFL